MMLMMMTVCVEAVNGVVGCCVEADERMDRELQKAALVAARSTKRQLKEKRIRAFDDDQPTAGSVCSDPSGPVNSCIFLFFL